MTPNRIKELREKNNFTQQDLSDLLKNKNISATRVTIARYEAGSRVPNEEVWKALAEIFKVPVPYVKGEGIRGEEVESKLINLLFSAYYDNNEELSNMKADISHFLSINGDKETADSFAKSDENYKNKSYVINFWKDKFKFLFDKNFEEALEGANDLKFIHDVSLVIRMQLEEIIMNQNDSDFIKDYKESNTRLMNEFYNRNNAYTLVPAMDHQIKILKKYRNLFLNHGYFESKKNDKQ
ncbi:MULTISPECIES: helix-turn-helix transcriptional regulator [Lactobacillus]|uniref:Transcriptional regulator n=2 Tax=Lactobacillus TaxID=1578 RepID=A0AB33CEU5_LACGS|nr:MULTISPECIES: helix-turn-helix transcriptional regulator [Lactobacillus]ART98239.1 transcriptional regulator [Lactobacillus gasseri]KWU03291.1 hypothetical protein AEL95_08045 [Lactobacillus crispatus]MCT7757423.1 helix-turn-helix transcriptional regulator [Lactobacillus gasseri]QHC52286.1 helix-turn-helix transcriptional regulator [Lactobacillus sp. JM1]QQP28564.1 helix-turn-helix transcriptional regulator [Lactobacillus ultunensis]